MFVTGKLWNMTQMMLIIWSILLLAVPTRARLQDLWKPDDSSIGEGMMRTIFETCYEHHKSTSPMIIIGDFKGSIDGTSIIQIGDSLNVDKNYRADPFWYNGPTKVVVVEHSLEKLQSDLELLTKTQWWEHRSIFFIIGNRREACSNFKNVLMMTWRMNIINSIYICPGSTNTAELYTLNPITNYALYPWERMEEFNDSNIYRQTFDPKNHKLREIPCRNLNYDKTVRLDGYIIRDLNNITRKGQKLKNYLISALNASHEVVKEEKDYELADIDVGCCEVNGIGRTLRLFPHTWEYTIAIVKTDEISTLQKIYSLWSPQVLHLAIISLIIFLSVLVVKNDDIVSGILDIVRFLTYVSIRTNTGSHSFRIYFTTMLILIIISNGVFQGKIASFLTKPDRTQPVKTVDELIELGYEVYSTFGEYTKGSKGWKFRSNCEKCTVILVDSDTCIDIVLSGTRKVCLLRSSIYEMYHMKQPLESIEESVKIEHQSTFCRNNWPLYDRAYYMSMRIFESGLYKYWENEESYERRHIREADKFAAKLEEIQPRYRPVKLRRLDFAFKLLAIGLSLAIIAFIVEWRDAVYLNP